MPPDEAVLKAALRLLSARGRTVKELRGRLLKKGLKSSDVSHCLRWLEGRDVLNDEAFARSFLLDRIRFSPRSPFLLEQELKKKGIRPSLAGTMVNRVLEEEETTEGELSVKAAEGWVRKQSPTVRGDLLGERFSPKREKARRRLYGFLARRGFAGEAACLGLEAGMEKARELGG